MFDFNILTFWSWISPLRALAIARNTRAMDEFLLPSVLAALDPAPGADPGAGRKTVVDLAVQALRDEAGRPDAAFVAVVLAQLKVFLFAGHDTTATSLCWALHALYRDPPSLARVRAELDAVLGPPAASAAVLRARPHLVHALPFTAACLREALRLWPAVGPIRDGTAAFAFAVPGWAAPAPTRSFMVWDGVRATSRSEAVWPRAGEFLPERWLVAEGHELYPPRNAWHPFGIGSRSCIGLELALVEMRLVLALVTRELEVHCAWEEWDAAR